MHDLISGRVRLIFLKVKTMNCELSAGMRFSLISRFFKKKLDEAGSKMELTGVQLMVLGQLNRLERSGLGQIRQRDLEKAAHLGHPTMTELIKRLEKKGFVQCCVSPTDRRSKLVRPTPCAHAFHEEMEEVDRQVFESLTQGMSEQQKAELISLLDIMIGNACISNGKEVC